MTAERLYYLVHSLTRDQKSNFTRYTKLGKKTLELVLYDRVLAQKQFDNKTSEVIRGKEFKIASKYYLYRVKLAERIIQSLVSFEDAKVSTLSFVRRAVTLDALELGEKALAEEMMKAQDAEDSATLRYLYDFAYRLQEDYNVQFSFHRDLKSRQEVIDLDHVRYQLEAMLLQIRKAFRSSEESRSLASSSIASRLLEIHPESQRSLHLSEKVQVGLSLLNRSLDQAQQQQKNLVEQMVANPASFSTTRVSREIASLIRLSEEIGDRETALRYTLIFGKLTPKTIIEQKEVVKEGITRTIHVGEYFAHLSFAESGILELENNLSQFEPNEIVINYLLLGLNFFYNREFSQALHCVQELRAIPRKEWDKVSWEPEILRLLCHLEMENIDVLDSLGRSAYRNTKKYDLSYPQLVVKYILKVIRATPPALPSIYEDGQEEITAVLQSANEKRAAHNFNFMVWLQAKSKGVSLATLLSHQGKSGFASQSNQEFGT